MIARAALIKWTLAASLIASRGVRSLPQYIAEAIVDEAIAAPLVATDAGLRTTLALGVSVAWFEGHNQLDPEGSNDNGDSHCFAQVNLPHGARTAEGWTGHDLRTSATRCAHVMFRLIKASVLAAPNCDNCELVIYAKGRDSEIGRAQSRHRVALAHRLIREVPLEVRP